MPAQERAPVHHWVSPAGSLRLWRERGVGGASRAGSMQEPSLQAGRSVAERSSELVRSLAPCYEKVLQEVSQAGRDIARFH